MKHSQARQKPKKPAATKNARHNSALPGWAWLISGVCIGVFISFLASLAGMAPTNGKTAKNASAEPDKTHSARSDNTAATQFDFYTMLPEREIVVEPEAVAEGAAAPPPVKYTLQAGSFRSVADADRLRAKLLLLGLEASVEAVDGKGGETWHRVQVGPFDTRSKMAKARSTLMNEGVEALLKTEKVSG